MSSATLPIITDADVGPPSRQRPLAIGLVGAGAIVRAGHLPAYRGAGFRVMAITDLDETRARSVATEFDIPIVHANAEDLISDPRGDIVDIAVTPAAQAAIVRAAIGAGKHVLAQKPFHTDLTVAAELVGLAEGANVMVAVNQQMRWDQVIRSNKILLDRGFFGSLVGATFDVHVLTDWSMWPWMLTEPGLEYFYHSIHYVDSIRYLFGEPRSVVASTARYPGQAATGETRTFTLYEFDDNIVVSVVADHNNWSPHPHAVVRCSGTDGQTEGTLGVLYDYPVGKPDTFSYWSRVVEPHRVVHAAFEGRWIPDAFVGPMADLQDAVVDGRPPLTSARDNLATLRVVHAAYQSAESGRRVHLGEITADAGLKTAAWPIARGSDRR
jgi:predicted dehydrogenase